MNGYRRIGFGLVVGFLGDTGMAAMPHPFLNLEQNAEVEVATPRMLDPPTGARIASVVVRRAKRIFRLAHSGRK